MSTFEITLVTFRAPVNIAAMGQEHWSRGEGLGGPPPGKVTWTASYHPDGIGLVFVYETKDQHNRVTVPWANIAQVTEKPVKLAQVDSKAHPAKTGGR